MASLLAAEIGGSYRQADVADPEAARALVAAVVAAHGRLDILVNNAGTTRLIPHADLEAATPGDLGGDLRHQRHRPVCADDRGRPALADRSGRRGDRQHRIAGRPAPRRLVDPVRSQQGRPAPSDSVAGRRLSPAHQGQRRGAGPRGYALDLRLARRQGGGRQITPMRRVVVPDDVADLVLAQVTSSLVTGEVWVVDSGLQLIR